MSFQAFENGVEVVTIYTPGYGGPALWELRAIWRNKIIEKQKAREDFQAGRHFEALCRTYGLRDEETLIRLTAGKEQAYRLCDFCKKPCRKPTGEPWATSRRKTCCSSECLEKAEA